MPLRASCPGTVTCAGMTDLAAAARAGLWCWPQQAPGLPRGACRHCACAPLSKRPGSPSLGFSLYTVLAQDYNKINMRSMFGLFPANRGAACGQFHPSLRAQGVHCAVPGRHPARGAVSRRNPQRFHRTRTGIRPLRTRHPMFVHRKPAAAPLPSEITGLPIRPCRRCSRGGPAPGLAGEHSERSGGDLAAGAAASARTASGSQRSRPGTSPLLPVVTPDHRGWHCGCWPASSGPGTHVPAGQNQAGPLHV